MPIVDERSLLLKEFGLAVKRFGIHANELLKSETFICQLDIAVRYEEHEGRIPPYGAVFTYDRDRLVADEILEINSSDSAMKVSDGIRSFSVFEAEKLVGIAVTSGKDEANLVEWSSKSNATVLVRRRNGTIDIFFGCQGILSVRNRVWLFKPHLNSILDNVLHAYPQVNKLTLETILGFAFHKLSPRRIGATLVWCIKQPTQSELQPMSPTCDLSGLKLQLINPRHVAALANILDQTDGATLLTPDGIVIGTGAQLKYTDKSREYIPEHKGTRHTSAKRFSYDYGNGILFAVSSDGPVSVYSDGISVATLQPYSSQNYAGGLARMIPAVRDRIYVASQEATCPKCGKTSEVSEVLIAGYRSPETAECPICESVILSKHSWDLKAHIVKKLR